MKPQHPIMRLAVAAVAVGAAGLYAATACAASANAAAAGAAAVTSAGAALSGTALLAALREGGLVLVMRHASSPSDPPPRSSAEPDNARLERQLDQAGRNGAQAMGTAIRRLHIPIGGIWSSPTYRALQTVKLAALSAPTVEQALGDNGRSMAAASSTQSAWLRAAVARLPRAGTNSLLVTQGPNISGAFGQDAAGMNAGDMLVFRPDGKGSAAVVARIAIGAWPQLDYLK